MVPPPPRVKCEAGERGPIPPSTIGGSSIIRGVAITADRQHMLHLQHLSEVDIAAAGGWRNAVAIGDLLQLLAAWGPCADCDNCPANLNDDCDVNIMDMLTLLAAWGPCP